MGEIIKDGAAFLAYANAGLIRKIDDVPALKRELVALGDAKTHAQLARYALLLAGHLLELGGVERTGAVEACFAVVARWLAGQARVRDALDIAWELNRMAKEEADPVRVKVLRALGQVAAVPHVRWHALVASEYAVVAVNLLYPGDLGRVRQEREWQIARLAEV